MEPLDNLLIDLPWWYYDATAPLGQMGVECYCVGDQLEIHWILKALSSLAGQIETRPF